MATPQPKAAVVTEAPPLKKNRMSLASLVKGKIKQPVKLLLYGVEGIGKSTFAASAPAPIFIGAENGTEQLDVTRFPSPEKWEDILDALRVLTNEAHEFKTVAIDTLDWAEPMLWEFICKRDNHANVEDYGYGKGYQAALDEWRVFLALLERLREAKKMHIIMLAHSWIKPFKNPQGEDYDRYELKLNAKASGKLKEWSDAVLFAQYETYATKDKNKRVRGVDTGARLIHTQHRAAFDAKNRFNLPEALPLAWADFEEAIGADRPADPEALTSEIQRKAQLLGPKFETATASALERAGNDASKLSKLNNWVNSKLIDAGVEQ